jgi:hypothetical protein
LPLKPAPELPMSPQMDDRLSDDARIGQERVARGTRRTERTSDALDRALGLLVVGAVAVSGFGIVAGLIYAIVDWSLLALIPLVLYLTAWLVVACSQRSPGEREIG